MNLFGVGPTEIIVVLIVILVLFGPDKLPEIAKKIGGASREIRDNLDTMNEQMNTALETSMDLEKAQMLAPRDKPVIDSTAQTIQEPKIQIIETPVAESGNPPTEPNPPSEPLG